MNIMFFNTLRKKIEVLKEIESGKISLYMCGITVYDKCHIGHARAMLCMDMIVRYLKFKGYKVYYVRNITDIDDKIISRAISHQESIVSFTARMIENMHQDLKKLNILEPDAEPKATDHIGHIIHMIEDLVSKGFAYSNEGDVYFNVKTAVDYGKFSGRQLRGSQESSSVKNSPEDFALWKRAKDNEISWDSPWGPGRPGWHIECSAISDKILGKQFDIHAGGLDLVFPHHENEIAQSIAYNSCIPANYWMHVGLVGINDEKMSKSLQNSHYIRDVLQEYHPDVLRMFCLMSHYRSNVEFSIINMENAKAYLERIYNYINKSSPPVERDASTPQKDESCQYFTLFEQAMDKDFNTWKALTIVLEACKNLASARSVLNMMKVLGFFVDMRGYFKLLKQLDLPEEAIDDLIKLRHSYRLSGNFSEADRIREQLKESGIYLEDLNDYTSWKKIH